MTNEQQPADQGRGVNAIREVIRDMRAWSIRSPCPGIWANNLEAAIAALSQPKGDDGLDFEPDESHTVPDMANVGYSLMQAIKRNLPDYCWNESPAEIVSDLLNQVEEAKATPAAPVGGFVVDATPEMLRAGLPHLIGVAGAEVRPVGQFYPGMTADESEQYNWTHLGNERLRRAYAAMIAVAPKVESK